MTGSACRNRSYLSEGIPVHRESDTGPIPTAMLDDLRQLLWKMEKLPMYWGVGMALIIGAAWIAGIALFMTADQRHPRIDDTSIGLGIGALTILATLLYSPFLNRWFDSKFEAKVLRETLYPQRLEDLSYYMGACRMGGRNEVANELLTIWIKHGLEPGWGARAAEPKPQFK